MHSFVFFAFLGMTRVGLCFVGASRCFDAEWSQGFVFVAFGPNYFGVGLLTLAGILGECCPGDL